MKINIEYDNYGTSTRLVDFVEKRVGKLDKFFDRIVQADVVLKSNEGKSTKQCVADIRLNVPNETLFASGEENNMEAAVTDAVNALERQLKKYKEKMNSHA